MPSLQVQFGKRPAGPYKLPVKQASTTITIHVHVNGQLGVRLINKGEILTQKGFVFFTFTHNIFAQKIYKDFEFHYTLTTIFWALTRLQAPKENFKRFRTQIEIHQSY